MLASCLDRIDPPNANQAQKVRTERHAVTRQGGISHLLVANPEWFLQIGSNELELDSRGHSLGTIPAGCGFRVSGLGLGLEAGRPRRTGILDKCPGREVVEADHRGRVEAVPEATNYRTPPDQ